MMVSTIPRKTFYFSAWVASALFMWASLDGLFNPDGGVPIGLYIYGTFALLVAAGAGCLWGIGRLNIRWHGLKTTATARTGANQSFVWVDRALEAGFKIPALLMVLWGTLATIATSLMMNTNGDYLGNNFPGLVAYVLLYFPWLVAIMGCIYCVRTIFRHS